MFGRVKSYKNLNFRIASSLKVQKPPGKLFFQAGTTLIVTIKSIAYPPICLQM